MNNNCLFNWYAYEPRCVQSPQRSIPLDTGSFLMGVHWRFTISSCQWWTSPCQSLKTENLILRCNIATAFLGGAFWAHLEASLHITVSFEPCTVPPASHCTLKFTDLYNGHMLWFYLSFEASRFIWDHVIHNVLNFLLKPHNIYLQPLDNPLYFFLLARISRNAMMSTSIFM